VTSAGPYSIHLHFAPDNFLQDGCSFWHPTASKHCRQLETRI